VGTNLETNFIGAIDMNISLQIKEMSLKEKLMTMEALWDDLCHEEERLDSPDWHKPVLEQRVAEAEEKYNFSDWETAKKDIRKSHK